MEALAPGIPDHEFRRVLGEQAVDISPNKERHQERARPEGERATERAGFHRSTLSGSWEMKSLTAPTAFPVKKGRSVFIPLKPLAPC